MIELNKIWNEDCLETMKRMEDNSVDSIVTDPPYGLLKDKIETYFDFKVWINECYRILKPNSFIVYHCQQPTMTEWNYKALKLFNYKTEIIWYKRHCTNMIGDISRVYENIMILVKGKRKLEPVKRRWSDVKNSLMEFANMDSIKRDMSFIQEIAKDMKKQLMVHEYLTGKRKNEGTEQKQNSDSVVGKTLLHIPQVYSSMKMIADGYKAQNLVSFMQHNNQKFNIPEHNIKHPTVKPIELEEYLISLVSNENDIIFDPFMGSGTTAIACINTNRIFIGSEISKEYCDIANERIKNISKVKSWI